MHTKPRSTFARADAQLPGFLAPALDRIKVPSWKLLHHAFHFGDPLMCDDMRLCLCKLCLGPTFCVCLPAAALLYGWIGFTSDNNFVSSVNAVMCKFLLTCFFVILCLLTGLWGVCCSPLYLTVLLWSWQLPTCLDWSVFREAFCVSHIKLICLGALMCLLLSYRWLRTLRKW